MSELKRIPGGLIVVFEGIDGTGKTTQLQLAAEALKQAGWSVETTRSHGGTPIGEELRKVSFMGLERPAKTDLYISMAMHAALAERLQQWREAGAITLVDRGSLSLAAYQIFGDGLDPDLGWPEVDNDSKNYNAELLITYTASVDIALARARQKPGTADYFESKSTDYFERVSQGYLAASERYGGQLVDAERSIEAVQADTLQLIHTAIDQKQPADGHA